MRWNRGLTERHDLHIPLLGQRLGQLVVGHEAHGLGHFAEQLPGPTLLVLEQHFKLLVGDEPQVDQNLTDPPHGHE